MTVLTVLEDANEGCKVKNEGYIDGKLVARSMEKDDWVDRPAARG
jgi:hypothetical protein